MDVTSGLDSLITVLDRVHANEFVVCIDPALIPVLSAVCSYSTLKDHGVLALVPLTSASSDARQQAGAVVYITRPDPPSILLVAQSARANAGASLTAVLVPDIPPSVPLLLTKHGVLGELDLTHWPLGFVADATQPAILNLFCEAAVPRPRDGVWPLVTALDALQASGLGAIGKITSVGPKARLTARLLRARKLENAVKTQQADDAAAAAAFDYRFGYTSNTFLGSHIEHLVVIDRDLDLVTPLLSQTTYEGVLDEVLGVSASGTVPNGAGAKVSLRDDPLFATIAERGFASACTFIHTSAKQLQQEYKQGEMPSQDSSLAEIKSAVSKIGSLQSTQKLVDTHTDLASTAMSTLGSSARRELYNLQVQILDNQITNTQAIARIQDLIFRAVPIQSVLRPLCLLCLVRGGIKQTVLQSLLYGDILRTYGYNHLPLLRYLKDRGLLFPQKGSSFLLSTAPFASLGSMALGGGGDGGSGSANTSASTNNNTSSNGGEAGGAAADDLLANNPLDTPLSQTYSWYALNKAYKMYPHDAETDGVTEPYTGYIPLTARLVQMALRPEQVAKTPLEPEFLEETFASKDAASAREAKLRRTLMRNSEVNSKPIILVAVVGGTTYAEATAIKRATQKSAKRDVHVVVATTCIITGDKLIVS